MQLEERLKLRKVCDLLARYNITYSRSSKRRRNNFSWNPRHPIRAQSSVEARLFQCRLAFKDEKKSVSLLLLILSPDAPNKRFHSLWPAFCLALTKAAFI